jgi:hypothetical protein
VVVSDSKQKIWLGIIIVIKEREGLILIRKSMLLNKDQMEIELGALRAAWGAEFDDLENFPEEELRQWLVSFTNDNEGQ